MEKENVLRRNLSGIYIFYKFENEEHREPTVFEDCPEEKQDEWMNGLEPDALKSLAKQLGGTIRTIGNKFDLIG